MGSSGDHRVPEDDDVLSGTQRAGSPARDPASAASAWHAADAETITWRDFDDELVVYNDATGSTHHLSPLCSEVMLALLRHTSAIEIAELVRDIADRVEAPDGKPLTVEIEHALAELAELGLAACGPA